MAAHPGCAAVPSATGKTRPGLPRTRNLFSGYPVTPGSVQCDGTQSDSPIDQTNHGRKPFQNLHTIFESNYHTKI